MYSYSRIYRGPTYVAPSSTVVFDTLLNTDIDAEAGAFAAEREEWASNMMTTLSNTASNVQGDVLKALDMAEYASNNSAFSSNLAKWVSVSLSNIIPDADINVLSMQTDLEVVLNSMTAQQTIVTNIIQNNMLLTERICGLHKIVAKHADSIEQIMKSLSNLQHSTP
jgi:hypothetical protein